VWSAPPRCRRPTHCAPLDQVALPVTGHRAGGHLGGTLRDGRHIGNLATAIGSSRPRAPRLARLPQRGQQLTAQGAAGQHIQARIDGLGRELVPHVVRIRASEASGDLLWRAALSQMAPHVLPEPRIQEFPRAQWVTGSGGRLDLRRTGALGTASCGVPGHLAAHVAGGTSQYPRHRSERMAVGQAQTQGLTFVSTQVCVALFWHGNTVAH
jgi:hypothetical protein